MRRLERQAEGRGAVVLVHGNDLCGEFYAALCGALAGDGLASRALTLPGFGGEPALEEPSWDAYADLVTEEVASTTGAPRVLAGHSMGGLIALLAAARSPAGLTHLVLLEPALFPYRWTAKAGVRRYLERVVHGDRTVFANSTGAFRRVADVPAYPPEMIDLYVQCRGQTHVDTVDTLFRTLPDLYPLPWKHVQVPVLLVTGSATGVRGRMLARALRRRLPRLSHRVIDGAAHWLANERDTEVAAAVAEFVQ